MPAIEGELVPCKNGYHGARDAQVLEWLGPELYEMEYRGTVIDAGDKVVGREARLLWRITTWNERTSRLFAVWCARHALSSVSDPDPRSVAACDIAERYANSEASPDELDAAWDAARDATLAAAWDAAMDARGAAWNAARAAWNAAWAAARDAACAAARAARTAWDAAWDAASDDVRDAQYARLCEMLEVGQ
jgi:hypothetical protein